VEEAATNSIDQQTALCLAENAWKTSHFANIVAGFKTCDLAPLCRERMGECVAEFERNGTPKEIQAKQVIQQDVLLTPPVQATAPRPKRTKPGGRLLTRKLLELIAKEKADAAAKFKKRPAPKKTAADPRTSKPRSERRNSRRSRQSLKRHQLGGLQRAVTSQPPLQLPRMHLLFSLKR
jgi:hypothetical protein